MTPEIPKDRWQEIRVVHREYKFFYQVGGGAAFVLLGLMIGYFLFSGDNGYVLNIYTEVLSISVTVFVLNLLARRREKDEYKRRLIRQMYSPDNGLALQAVWELIAEGWTTDGSLKEKYFVGANLYGAILSNADLEKSVLTSANLGGASLQDANLQKADLSLANLQGAYLWQANLCNSRLHGTNFEGTELAGADLRGAFMYSAYLKYAVFRDDHLFDEPLLAIFDETTILPDWTHYNPEKGLEQLERFTNPAHPDFWEPDIPYGSWK